MDVIFVHCFKETACVNNPLPLKFTDFVFYFSQKLLKFLRGVERVVFDIIVDS